jgi:apolipoprotein N-acyltransferase
MPAVFLWLAKLRSNTKNILAAVMSGLLLTASFPKIGIDWLAWFALVPLLYGLREQSAGGGFRIGFIAGLSHYLTLLYWLVPVMQTYGFLPWSLSIVIMILFSVVLALFMAIFSMIISRSGTTPWRCFMLIPPVWIAVEYIRGIIFTGFPWELMGYSQFERLHLIQIADLFGVYGVSFLITLSNSAIFLCLLYFTKKHWQAKAIAARLAAVATLVFFLGLIFTLAYGYRRLGSIDRLIAAAPQARVSVVQGNIDQAIKWDRAFRDATIKTYERLSLSAAPDRPDLVIWPESATPFYFLKENEPTEKVMHAIRRVETDFILGSPSFVRQDAKVQYLVSAYLIDPRGKWVQYNKAHLVPFGEYVPLKKWIPFLGKMVAQVGDFVPGKKGKTIAWKNEKLGIQICYEIIFPDLSRAMVKNGATLLINITNDAWFGKTSGPFQHFSMTVLRAVENRRALARSANTGISGFIDPAGRILAATPLMEEAVVTRSVPLLKKKTIYTRFGDVLAWTCLAIVLSVILFQIVNYVIRLRN